MKTNHIFFLIAIFLVSMVAGPAYAATPKKSKTKKKAKPELTHVGNTYYVGGSTERLHGKQVLDFYAKQNCQAAYDEYKKGMQCRVAGICLLAGGAGVTVAGLGCVIGGAVNTVKSGIGAAYGAATGGSTQFGVDKNTMLAGGILIGVGLASQIAGIPTLVVGKKKRWRSVDTYNSTCRTACVQPYWSIQTYGNGVGVAYHF